MKNSKTTAHSANTNQQLINVLEQLTVKHQSQEMSMLIKYMRSDGQIDPKSSKQLLSFLDNIVEEIDKLKTMRSI